MAAIDPSVRPANVRIESARARQTWARYSSEMSSRGTTARMSWFKVTANGTLATGRRRRSTLDRTTNATDPGGTSFAAEALTACSETRSSVETSVPRVISFGESQGIVPFCQYSGTDLDGVPPPYHVPTSPSRSYRTPSGQYLATRSAIRLMPHVLPGRPRWRRSLHAALTVGSRFA